ncbi:hypothetical protein JR334_02025 [Clostridia bacterium]|nr:hypothetical protein JR334_02025 [Clostridia bacterium]
MASIKVTPDTLEAAIAEALEQYGDAVFHATEAGLTAAEKILIQNLKADSPEGVTKSFKKGWKGKGKKYKLKRYVGNTVMVPGKKGSIPLSNILEYAENGHPFIRKTFERSIDQMVNAIIDEVKKGT